MVPMEWEIFRENMTRVSSSTLCPLPCSPHLACLERQILGGVELTKKHKLPPLVYLEKEDSRGAKRSEGSQ